MHKILLTLASCIMATTLAYCEGPQGTLMLIGGAERDNNLLLWNEFVANAGGPGKSVAVLATASSNPDRTAKLFAAHLENIGLKPFIVPASKLLPGVDLHQIVRDPEWCQRIEKADAVFLAGGEQARYRQAFIADDGSEVPMLKTIRSVYQRGGVIAGTSAGMAIMSRMMYIDAELILPVLVHGARLHREVDEGLGLFPKDWFVDQHFLARGRFGRTLVAMQQYDFPYGVGVDEDTAILLEQGKTLRVVGYRGALLMDASKARRIPSESKFSWEGIRLDYLSHGDQVDLVTHQVTPGKEKRDQDKVDPKKPDFKPYYLHPQFYNDIFANTQLLDLMYKLVDSPHEQAIGLAFDGAAARKGSTPGFEFRFYRKEDTVSWESPIAQGDQYTVLNIYLDIRPIEIAGPLYR